MEKRELGIYVHIPFCARKCAYCDFLSFSAGKNVQQDYFYALQKEIASADEIYLMVSFIKKRGLALILPQLKEFTNRGGKLKVITTTYMQATDFDAIMQLSALKNTDIKITYDTVYATFIKFLNH